MSRVLTKKQETEEEIKGKFKVKDVISFDDLVNGKRTEVGESDLCFQNDKHIIQFEYEKPDEEKKVKIKPGSYDIIETPFGLNITHREFRVHNLLEEVDNTSTIINEAKLFFDKLNVYEKLGRIKKRGVLMYSQPGMGKCLGKNTPILMYDGTVKKVQNVNSGDLLMGPDSTPREVLSTTSGVEQLYKIIPNKGEPYVVNESHILSLRMSGTDELHNISVKEYLKLPAYKLEKLKGWRVGVDFNTNDELIIDPYFLGLWLGDGCSSKTEICSTDAAIIDYASNYYESLGLLSDIRTETSGVKVCRATSGNTHGSKDRNILMNMLRSLSLINNKHIPLIYKTASRQDRLKLLAGLIDTDGSVYGGVVDFCMKDEALVNDIAFLARSLGFAAYIKKTQKTCANSKSKATNTYFRVQISGDIDEIPAKLLRKQADERKQVKNHLRTGITVEKLEIGEYFGFEINGDKLFLLGDFTVTHNTSAISKFCRDFMKEDKGTVVLNWPTSEIESDRVARFLSTYTEYTKECTRLVLIIEDIGGGEHDYRGGNQVSSGLLNLLDGVGVTFKLPTFIAATTNHPENLLESLADRPGRFDLMLELEPPGSDERIKLCEFIAQRVLTDEEKAALRDRKADKFSIAHIEEVVVRSLLHDKSIPEVVKELIEHSEKYQRAFEKEKRLGIGG